MGIQAVTIRMQPPVAADQRKRVPAVQSDRVEQFLLFEETLRKSAYKNTAIRTGASFYDDSDMRSAYYLVVVYDKKTATPLLSARYYFEESVIDRYLRGDDAQERAPDDYEPVSYRSVCKEDRLFLADRLSGNTENALYVQNRNKIFLLFYSEIFRHNKTCKFLLMARKERYERLLTKYLRLGLTIVGATRLRDKEHWILLGDLKEIRRQVKRSLWANCYLLWRLYRKPTIH